MFFPFMHAVHKLGFKMFQIYKSFLNMPKYLS